MKIFKYYLILYFLFPVLTLYYALVTGIKIPAWIEIIPVILCIINKNRFKYLRTSDFLFLVLIINALVFIIINWNNYSWIKNIEIRSFILIGINYFIFRILIKYEWADKITEIIIKLFKFSMYLIIFEFIAININDNFKILENQYLNIYQESERLYEFTLFGMKPLGLYPGTHNASVASTIVILYLKLTNTITKNKFFFGVTFIAFIVSISITSLIVLIIVYSIFKLYMIEDRRQFTKKILLISINILILFMILINYDFISQIKAHGEIIFLNVDVENNVYINSIMMALKSLLQFPLGAPLKEINLVENEIYISRLIMYYGLGIIIFFVIGFIMVVRNIKYQENYGIFLSISYMSLFISSFHYGSINYYPLTILVPLTFILIKYPEKLKSRLMATNL